MSSCLHVYMHIKNIMFNILTIFFNWSKFLLKKFMTWYFLDKKIKNAEYGKIPFVSARNFCWNWNYAKNCHFLKLWLTEHLKGSEEYYFRLPRKEIQKKKNYPNCVKIEQVMRFYVLQDGFWKGPTWKTT